MKDEEEYRRYWKLESFKHTINSGRLAMQNGVLLNGGAAVALMTFLGHSLNGGSVNQPVFLTWALASLIAFGLGAGIAAAAFGTTYFSQSAFTHYSDAKGNKWMYITVTLVCVSYLLFLLGLISAGISLF